MNVIQRMAAGAVVMLVAHSALAQVPTPAPEFRGPMRKGAGGIAEATGVPGVTDRINQREAARAQYRTDLESLPGYTVDNRWRYVEHKGDWWYYTPAQRWQYYRNNAWNDFIPPAVPQRYTSGYRGPVYDRTYYRRSWVGRRFGY